MKEILKNKEFWAGIAGFAIMLIGGYLMMVIGYMIGVN